MERGVEPFRERIRLIKISLDELTNLALTTLEVMNKINNIRQAIPKLIMDLYNALMVLVHSSTYCDFETYVQLLRGMEFYPRFSMNVDSIFHNTEVLVSKLINSVVYMYKAPAEMVLSPHAVLDFSNLALEHVEHIKRILYAEYHEIYYIALTIEEVKKLERSVRALERVEHVIYELESYLKNLKSAIDSTYAHYRGFYRTAYTIAKFYPEVPVAEPMKPDIKLNEEFLKNVKALFNIVLSINEHEALRRSVNEVNTLSYHIEAFTRKACLG